MTIKAAIFDMDGTILDTIEDLANAINHTMRRFGYSRQFTTEEAKVFFCNGAKAAVADALKAAGASEPETAGADSQKPEADTSPATLDEVLAYYKPYYASHCNIKTGPYPGIIELLKKLSSAGVKTAVVSNKPDPAVQKLCEEYFPDLFDFSLGEVAGIRRKPAPDMIAVCLKELQVSAEDAVYIGDSEVDVQTAANSGLPCIAVDWGFRSRESLTGAARIVSDSEELAEAILSGTDL